MTEQKAVSPKILSAGWGKMEIETLGKGRDFKLWPGGGKQWDWSEHGTGHGNGIQPAEVEELVAAGCKTVILTTGRLKRLKVPQATIERLEEATIEVVVCATKKGIRDYNLHVDAGDAVGGLFHSTC